MHGRQQYVQLIEVDLSHRRRFGRSDIELEPLGFGGNALGNLYASVDEFAAEATVREAYGSGVRYFDTAPLYGHGLSEHRIGRVLRRVSRDSFVLSSKVGRILRPHGKTPPPRLDPSQGGIFADELPFSPVFDYSYDGVLRSFEDSLQRLGLNRIDILLIHDADEWTHKGEYAARLEQVEKETVPALERLKSEGAIRSYGAGVNQAEACLDLMRRGDFDGFLLAGRYTLLEQGALAGLLPRAVERGVSIILGAPFNSGILVTGARPEATYNYLPAPESVLCRVAEIERVCAEFAVPLPAAALQFPMGHPAVVTNIPGARSPEEVRVHRQWMSLAIPGEFWQTLRGRGLIHSEAPVPMA